MFPAIFPVRTGVATLVAVMVLDQITKHLVLGTVAQGVVIPVTSFFNLVLVWNVGISFGMMQAAHALMPYILSAVAGGICLWLFRWLQDARTRFMAIALGLIMGGALGNVIDRLLYGAVIDFLDFHAYGHHWPAFNVADSAICIGVFMLLLGERHKSA